MKTERWLVVLGSVLCGLCSGPTSAQDIPLDASAAAEQAASPRTEGGPTSTSNQAPEASYAEYEAALSEALEAHARGDYGQARIFMERAHEIEPSARTLRGLGIVAFAQGRHLDSIRYLDASLQASEKPLPQDLRVSVEELLTHAWGQVGRLKISLEPTGGHFLINRREPEFYAPGEVVLTPGRHTISAKAPQRADYKLTLDVTAGDARTIQLVLARPPAPTVIERYSSAPAPERTPLATVTTEQRLERLLWATGATLIVSGAAIYGTAYFRLNNLKARCEDRDGGACSQARATRLYREKNIEGLGIAAAAVGGAGLVTTLVAAGMRFKRATPRNDNEPRVEVGFGSVSVSGRF